MKFLAVALLALPIAAIAQQSDDIGQSTKQPVHVTVEVKSKLYGSFTQERDVNLGETVAFSNLGAHHKAVLSDGSCQITADAKSPPQDIDDGVVVKITPELHSTTGVVGFEDDIVAHKFIKYNVLNEGKCGNISMADSVSDSTASSMIYHMGKPFVLTSMRRDTEGDHRDLDVIVTFTPVAAH
jgi:RNA-binding protein YhbY